MEHLRFSIGGSSAEGRTLNVYWYTSQAHRRNRSTDLSDIVWIGGCKRLHLFICDEREITEKKPSLGYIGMSATSGKHELWLNVLDEFSVGSIEGLCWVDVLARIESLRT